MIVAAAAVIVGVVFMGVMMARVGTANDAMQAAMQQVAASNEALMQAMAEQRKGNEALLASLSSAPATNTAPPALELSDIEIILRRGSKEGPPAPEVEVTLSGKGADGETMTIRVEPDADGRALFERLYQGSYSFAYHDPVSQLNTVQDITLFAGRGAGEHIIIVPDIEPRVVHLELGLPAYGRDEEQLVSITAIGSWGSDDNTQGLTWRMGGDALIGHSGTWSIPRGFGAGAWDPAENGGFAALDAFRVTGDVTLEDIGLHTRGDDGRWSRHSGALRRGALLLDTEFQLLKEDESGAYFTLSDPTKLAEAYGTTARCFRSREHVNDDAYTRILNSAAEFLPEAVVVDARGPLEQKNARYRGGLLFGADFRNPGARSDFASGDGGGTSHVALLKLPESPPADSESGGMAYLALDIGKVSKSGVEQRVSPPSATTGPVARGTRLRSMDDLAGNTLAAYAIRVPWDGMVLPEYDRESEGGGLSIAIDREPFWRSTSDVLEASKDAGALFIPLPQDALAGGDAPVTGILLKWEVATEDFYWELEFDAAPCWIVAAPLSDTGESPGDQPLKDIDGRFHYDSIRSQKVDLVPAEQ